MRAALLIEHDVLSADGGRLRKALDEALLRVKLWLKNHPDDLLPLEGVQLAALCERHNARLRQDRRHERRLAMQERVALARLGEVSDDEIEAEIGRLLARRLAELGPMELRALAAAREREERDATKDPAS